VEPAERRLVQRRGLVGGLKLAQCIPRWSWPGPGASRPPALLAVAETSQPRQRTVDLWMNDR
jgi:hypothetical protein